MKRLIFILLLCSVSSTWVAKAQIPVFTEKYSVLSGLCQDAILDMVKDESGFIWFASRDGLSRFDGNSFLNFKAQSKELKRSVSNQFHSIITDQNGCFWILNDIGQVLRFNPRTEIFELYPSAEENRGDGYFTTKELVQLPDGKIWLLGNGNGAIRVDIDDLNKVKLHFFCDNEQSRVGSFVTSVFQDSDQRTWLLTNRGVAMVEQDTVLSMVSLEDSVLCAHVGGMVEMERELLFSVSEGRLYRFSKSQRRFTLFQMPSMQDLKQIFRIDEENCLVLAETELWLFNAEQNKIAMVGTIKGGIDVAWQDVLGDIWIKHIGGLSYSCYFAKNQQLSEPYSFRFSGDGLVSMSKFSSGGLWRLSFIDERNALWTIPSEVDAWYSKESEKSPYFSKNKGAKFAPVVHATFIDTMGIFWQTSHSDGVVKCVSANPSFLFSQNEVSSNYSDKNEILSMMEDDHQILWEASNDGYVRLFDKNDNLIGYLSPSGAITTKGVRLGLITSMTQGRDGTLWMGGDNQLFALKRQSDENYQLMECRSFEEEFEMTPFYIEDILEDSKGRIWLATDGGGLHLLQKEEKGYRFVHKGNLFRDNYPPIVDRTQSLCEDRNQNIWVGSSEGLIVFSSDFSSPEEIRFFFYNTENTNLTNSNISDIYEDKDGVLWFASFGGGLFKLAKEYQLFETPEFVSYSFQNNQFPSDLVLDIIDDDKGLLWVVTEETIVKFDSKSQKGDAVSPVMGLERFGFLEHSILFRKSGKMVVGTRMGRYKFIPSDVQHSDFSPKVVFTGFSLYNKEVKIGQKESPIKQTINYENEIVLQPHQDVFSIHYSSLDYRHPDNVMYAYKLDNFEESWNYVGNLRSVTYTNLPHGEYYFRVRSTNSEGVWFDNDRVLKIVVLPTFWQTGWAYLLYLVLLISVVALVIYLYRLRTQMEWDKKMAASKLQFFTDISHELRTPLTLISAPLEKVLAEEKISEDVRKQLEVVNTNTNRMLRMMNQILDFRKLQSNKMRLNVQRTQLGEFITSCTSNFLKLAENRNICFSVDDKTDGATFWFDRDKLDTVMFNLLSNAFKFTESGKSVSVSLYMKEGNGVIEVRDEGCGMPKDKLSTIFERYITLKDYSLTKQSGTGIGLSLVKEIVELHKAEISVDSEEGKGSCFTLVLPSGYEHIEEFVNLSEEEPHQEVYQEGGSIIEHDRREKSTLLIVEDNAEMREFLRSVLSNQFHIFEAENGKIGYEMAMREVPEFILTDIMMPVMDGIELTRRVRENEEISHIPIILLTAKSDIESKVDCMKLGATDYITKPFSMPYLEARINNILQEREKWQEKYRQELFKSINFATATDELKVESTEEKVSEEEVVKVESKDEELMRQFLEYVPEHIDNSDLSVEEIQDALKVSRWHLLSKVKSLVGLTPTEFIRETRLAHAAKLIEEGENNMTQITYMIGMTDSRYFSRCFKQKYGVTPTEYKTNKKKN
jgi:signal transduction histidine kinase/DNA-binding response OmpR family regulator/ligand-binding sensor domain-containing protein